MRIGTIEIDEQTAAEIFAARQYIATYARIYEIYAPNAACPYYHAGEVYNKRYNGKSAFARRGKWKRLTAEQVNELVGFKLVNTESDEKE